MTSINANFDYKTTITISFDIDNFNTEEILTLVKNKLNTIKQCSDVDETIIKARSIEDLGCDCYGCISGSITCSKNY
jgi:hypothetical protein